jgi:putative ABC transport system permease protein
MFRNYLVVAFRNLKRSPGYTLINAAGLAVGMAAFILILLFVRSEVTYDVHHDRSEDVYRVVLDAAVMGQEIKTTNTSAPLAPTLLAEYPEVESAARIDSYTQVLVEYQSKKFTETNFFLADSSLFEILEMGLVSGDSESALSRPLTIVISVEMSQKYFGSENPIGKFLRVDDEDVFEITGVFRQSENRSHFNPDFIGSFVTLAEADSPIWLNNTYFTYVRLAPQTDIDSFESKLDELVKKYVGPQVQQFLGQNLEEAFAAGFRYDFVVENIRDIYLYSDAEDQMSATGNIQYVYILSVIGIFVLVIACINFTNLSTARAASRAREVGMRKVLGSQQSQLVVQFLAESVFLASVSMLAALSIVYTSLPAFNATLGSNLVLDGQIVSSIVIVALLTGLLSGAYPAFILSKYRPITVLKGKFNAGFKGSRLRSSLVVFQFAISIVLLVGTAVVFKQLNFLQDQDLGFDKDQIVVLPIESEAGRAGVESLRNSLLTHPGVLEVAAGGAVPGPNHVHNNTVYREQSRPPEDVFLAASAEISFEYVDALGLEMVSGRNFSRDFPGDSSGWLINESAAQQLGYTADEAVGKGLVKPDGEDASLTLTGNIVGVVKDFHYESFHTRIRPIVFRLGNGDIRYLPVRLSGDDVASAVAFLETNWSSFEPSFPFRYFFLDSEYAMFYEQEQRLSKLYTLFTGLAIVIACLGLFGLASYVTTQRTREIGVRKVLGASVGKIVVLLSREFTMLVLIACVIAFPIAWLAMNRWLQDFAYSTEIGWSVFVLSGIAAVGIAWLTVGYQSIRAAIANPVKSLRTEYSDITS